MLMQHVVCTCIREWSSSMFPFHFINFLQHKDFGAAFHFKDAKGVKGQIKAMSRWLMVQLQRSCSLPKTRQLLQR